MAFLVQTTFKNGFKDFRFSDVEYHESLDSVVAEGYPWEWMYWVEAPLFSREADAEVFAEILGSSLGVNVDVEEGEWYHHRDSKNVRGFAVNFSCASIKVWELIEGEKLKSGETYVLTNSGWVLAKQIKDAAKKVLKDYTILDPQGASFRNRLIRS